MIGYIILLPFAGFLALAYLWKRLNKTAVSVIGVGSVGISAILTLILGISFLSNPPVEMALRLNVWNWFDVGELSPGISFYLDAVSLTFAFVITFVGFLIHLYSAEYMADDEDFSRFFAYMNLFVGSMLVLVLADNLLLLYLGWEGVGLCSFLLIGFWYKEAENAAAARKAFVVTRVGDTAMAIGLFLLFLHFNTLNIPGLLETIPQQWTEGSSLAFWASILLLGGAVGKSAQLPLQTWLPDAMAGPSPVSALIHAATMVTAGVYLIARMHVVFALSPAAMTIVAIVGAVTLLIAGFSALAQSDIKRVLAYSTISQIGYMFLALGVGAWSAAVFHFMIHAFFKALLFLGAGAVILALHHEQNMFRMGGLRRKLPLIFWTYLIGSASLAALPLITAGFYSKDQILWYAWSLDRGGFLLWLGGVAGAFLTAVYTFRMIFLTFYGTEKTHVHYHPGALINVPLVVLAFLSLFGGFIDLPHNMGHVNFFSGFMSQALPAAEAGVNSAAMETILQMVSGVLALSGVYVAYLFYIKKPSLADAADKNWSGLKQFFYSGWGFDKLYEAAIVRPAVYLSRINKRDFIDRIYTGIANLNIAANKALSETQSGNVRKYAMGFGLGVAVILLIILAL